jgi:ceramide glucosyltransferase
LPGILAVTSWLVLAAAGVLVAAGLGQMAAGLRELMRFNAAPRTAPAALPGVSILKPLHGDDPMLGWALSSVCGQQYPLFQVVFGVADANDPALAVVRDIQQRYPACDIAVVVDPTLHGANRKVSNLINMLPAARHDVLVISDADVHAPPDWLIRLMATLERPGIGLATTLYAGLAVSSSMVARLGAMQITHRFLPGTLLGRVLGRQDCLGASMALRRTVLTRIGGLPRLADELADDAMLGRLVRQAGLAVALAPSIPSTTVAETRLGELLLHELRWARTVRAQAPFGHAASVVQYPLAWAMLALLATGLNGWAWLLLAFAWIASGILANRLDHAVGRHGGLATLSAFWLLPLRDLMSVGVILASYTGSRVIWRGQVLYAVSPRLAPEKGCIR